MDDLSGIAGLAQLPEGALARVLVVPPAQELRPVADTPRAHVVETHLDDQLGSKRHPLELPVGLPAKGVGGPALAALILSELLAQLPLLLRLEAGGVTDDAELAIVV